MAETALSPAAKKIKERTEVEVLRRKAALKEPQLLTRENVAICELSAEQIIQVLNFSLDVRT